MTLVLALTKGDGRHLAEVGFLAIAVAGVWLAGAQLPVLGLVLRRFVAGLLLAAGGVLVLVAVHWGHFG